MPTQPTRLIRRPDRSARRRRRPWHRLFKAIIVLAVPFYCIGFTLLAMIRIESMLIQAAASPTVLAGLFLFLLLLVTEPFTGMMTNTCVAGAKCAAAGISHPAGCLTFLSLLASISAIILHLT